MYFTFQAAQKSGRNAIAFDGAIENLNELSVKASAIARHHNTKFRPGVDGNILTMLQDHFIFKIMVTKFYSGENKNLSNLT